MTAYNWLILPLWLILVAYWAASAARAKRSLGAGARWKTAALRVAVVALVIAALRLPALRHLLRSAQAHLAANAPVMLAGLALCGAGIGLAILARAHLGRNWGMPMSRKEDPELVTSGPYAVVRHPIYAGMLAAMLGSALAQSLFWVVPLVLFGSYFTYSARREEKLMAEQFPAHYPAYMQRTKMLLPFVL